MEKYILHTSILLLAYLMIGISRVNGCPTKCNCFENDHDLIVVCTNKTLTKFPKNIPSNTSMLYIDLNCFTHLTRKDFNHLYHLHYLNLNANLHPQCNSPSVSTTIDPDTFTGVPLLRTLLMQSSYFQDLPTELFAPLQKLKKLDLSHNQLSFHTAITSISHLNSPCLEYLQLSSVGVGDVVVTFRTSYFKILSRFKIRELYLENDYIDFLYSGILQYLPYLEVFSIKRNFFRTLQFGGVDEIFFLPNLRRVDLSMQNWHQKKMQTANLMQRYKLYKPLILDQVPCALNIQIKGPLEWVSLSKISGIAKNVSLCLTASNLKYFDISHSVVYHFNVIFMPNSSLEFLSIQFCQTISLHPDMLKSAVYLKTLLLGGNNISTTIHEHGVRIFKNQQRLKTLDLASNSIKDTYLRPGTFGSLNSLVTLNLSDNLLSLFDTRLIEPLSNLKLLNLAKNRFLFISREFRGWLDSHENTGIAVDFYDNPFICDCSSIEFVKWFRQTRVTIHNRLITRCFYNNNQILINAIDLQEFTRQCASKRKTAVTIFVCIVLLFAVAMVIITLGFRHRWKLRYLWFITWHHWRRHAEEMDPVDYEYDAFVGYNRGDAEWVLDHLLPAMEEETGFKLCIHDRDFTPGRIIEETIVSSIEQSRKTILILSNHFLESTWCYFEMQMARQMLFSLGKDVIILVILTDLPARQVAKSKTLQTLLSTKTYLEWPVEAEGHELFWHKLRAAIQSPNNNPLQA